MVFPGRFADHLIADRLDRISLSFLADSSEIRRGGAAANIAIGLGRLGLDPLLAGAVGTDFADYRDWLHDNGVDTALVRVSASLHTARFVCTTDADHNQIATFYSGAMAEAREISLVSTARQVEGIDLVVIAPNDPEAMRRHTEECRRLGLDFAADPSQQLARLNSKQTCELVEGARFLFTNEYEAALLQKRSGWSHHDVLQRVGTWITTLGANGVTVARAGRPDLRIPAVPTAEPADPTGAGDSFRAGFLAGAAWNWPHERAAQLGCAMATAVLESVGTQEHTLRKDDLLHRIENTYGTAAALEIAPRLTG
nr:carbohydrate kinase family protein [Streptomyces spiramenti]